MPPETMPPDPHHAALRGAVERCLEGIVDPCSQVAGAPAGLVSMGLVGDVTIEGREGAARVAVTLFVTEPGCLMGPLFELTARRDLAALPGVDAVEVRLDHAHIWDPDHMTPEYRRRLAAFRACQSSHMNSLHRPKQERDVIRNRE